MNGTYPIQALQKRLVNETVASGFSPFKPKFPWIGGDLQTVRSTLLRDPETPLVSSRILVDLPDSDGPNNCGPNKGGQVSCAVGGPQNATNTLVLFHGLGGHEDSAYIKRVAAAYHKDGWRTVRVNARGVGPSRSSSKGPYSGGLTGDARAILRAVTKEWGAAPHAIGFSLGGQLLLRMLGEDGDQALSYCRAAVTVSAPIDLSASVERLENRRNAFYQRYLVKQMRRDLGPIFGDRVAALPSIRQIDHELIAPCFGYESAEAYYAGIACGPVIADIAVPTLAIHAADDPWIPVEDYRNLSIFPKSGTVIPFVTKSGGHVGFIDRFWGDHYVSGLSLKFYRLVVND